MSGSEFARENILGNLGDAMSAATDSKPAETARAMYIKALPGRSSARHTSVPTAAADESRQGRKEGLEHGARRGAVRRGES